MYRGLGTEVDDFAGYGREAGPEPSDRGLGSRPPKAGDQEQSKPSALPRTRSRALKTTNMTVIAVTGGIMIRIIARDHSTVL